MRHAPSMTGLRVLEAVVRTGGLSAAARELCVTPAAISHRLRSLETHSAAPLVHRAGGRFAATELGQRVLDALGDAFARIRAADTVLQDRSPLTLRIVASYSFAVLWLAPRLSRFQDRHPDLRLFVEPSHNPTDQGLADVTILHAADAPQAPGWIWLFADSCAAIGRSDHPVFAANDARPAAALQGKVVHVSHGMGAARGAYSWQQWAARLDIACPAPLIGASVTAEHLAVDLVLAQDALALISVINASFLQQMGRLRAIAGSQTATGCSYWARPAGRDGRAKAVATAFVDWIQAELAHDTTASLAAPPGAVAAPA